jgi:hypothetical protein
MNARIAIIIAGACVLTLAQAEVAWANYGVASVSQIIKGNATGEWKEAKYARNAAAMEKHQAKKEIKREGKVRRHQGRHQRGTSKTRGPAR